MRTESMVVAVTGASGFVGGTVVRRLLEGGASVRALVRNREEDSKLFRRLDTSRITFVQGDVTSAESLLELVRGAAAAVNLVGIIREGSGGRTFQKIHVEGTSNLIHACRDAGVKRFIQMSAMGVKDQGVNDYQRSKFEAESIVRRSGLDWTILRPALIHGARGEFTRLVVKWARGQDPLTPMMPYFMRASEDKSVPLGPTRYEVPRIAPIHVDDVAECVAAALESEDAIGEVFHLCGAETLTWPEMYGVFRSRVPHAEPKRPIVGLPGDLCAIGAKVCGMIGLGAALPFDEGMARMSQENASCSNAKVEQVLGVRPEGFTTTFERYASAL